MVIYIDYKTLFLIPPFEYNDKVYEKVNRRYPHTGTAYMAAMLKQNRAPYEIIDMNLGYSPSQVSEFVKQYNPDAICTTAYSFGYKRVYNLIDSIKSDHNKDIVIGGPHISVTGKEALEKTKADFAVIGEGEHTLLELIENPEYEKIKGLIWRKNSEIVMNERRPYIQDLDSLPFPAYEDFELEKYLCNTDKRLPIITSRGCPYQCNFCCTRISMGNKFRKRSPENVVDEIEYWYKKGWSTFDINDDIFSLDRNRAKKICEQIIERGLDIQFNLSVGLRVDTVDKDLLKNLKAAGCNFISYGCESGNDQILKDIKKGIQVKDVINAVNMTRNVGIKHKVNFIIGHPTETYEDAMDSIKLAKNLKCDFVSFNNLIPYPGTEVYSWIENNKNARFLSPPEVYLNEMTQKKLKPVFETDEFPVEKRKKALKQGSKLEEKTLSQFRFGKFKGYLVYLLNQNENVSKVSHRLFDKVTKMEPGYRIYNSIVKSPWE
jgi:radical SAM superfamily enzyme YgiQ (UPF0313 family)